MDYSAELDGLQQQVMETKSAVQAATTESREQRRQRIDQAQVDANQAAQKAPQGAQGRDAQNKWAQMRSNANDKMGEIKARIDKRNQEMDADMAATDADWAEADAAEAMDTAAWTLNNARVAMLDAIDARAYANVMAGGTR